MSDEIRVLHVDDEPEFAEMTATFLERENDRFSVETATDSEEGLEHLGENEYDCVVSDYDMPGTDGIEFLESVRKEYSDLPFILFTGKGSEEVASEAISKGVTDYLQKRPGTEQYELLVNRIGNVVERHHTEAELRESEEKYRTLVENSHDAVYIATDNTSLDFVNDRACEITGYSEQELLSMNPLELVHPEEREVVRKRGEMRWAGGDPPNTYDARVVTEDGETRHCEFTVEIINNYQGERASMGSLNDITERKRREKRLRELKKRLDLAVEGAGLGVWDWDVESGEVNHDERLAEMFGIPPGEGTVSIESVWDSFHPDDVSEIEEHIEKPLSGERNRYDIELRCKSSGGDWKWVRSIGQVVERDQDGQATRVVGVNIDIDERKRQKEELERYKTFINSSSDVITHISVDGKILYQSPAVKEVFGYEQEDLVGDEAFEHVHPDDRGRAAEEFYAVVENPEKDSGMVEYRGLNADGEYVWAESTGKDQRDTEVGGVVINQRDITERKRREKELERQNERLEEFAGVVSHDLRNPLTVAKGRLELVKEDCDSDHLNDVEGALERMDALIEDILTLAREGSDVGEMETVETEEITEGCWGNVKTETATLVNELERKIEADPGRLKQVCENLLRNAVEHGGEGVTVTVGELDDGNGFYVADDGDGIPESEREDVFETGYSTSEKGTGFGLSIVEEIITAHGWEIKVTESKTGGARFEVSGVEMLETA